jgi:membrane-bound inhibitor of C-type lysozyme
MKSSVTCLSAIVTLPVGLAGLALVSLATSAMAQEAVPPKLISRATYQCAEGKGFTAEYRDDKTVRATFGSKVMVLPQVEAASGTKYSDGRVSLFSRNNAAMVDVGDKTLFKDCSAVGSVQGMW